MRAAIAASLFFLVSALAAPPAKSEGKGKAAPPTPAPPNAGIKTPGVQIPFDSLKAEAEISVASPGWITAGDAIFVPDKSKGIVVRIDPKTNKPLDPVAGLNSHARAQRSHSVPYGFRIAARRESRGSIPRTTKSRRLSTLAPWTQPPWDSRQQPTACG